RHYRERLEAFEAKFPGDRLKLDQKAHLICPWVDEMIREPLILDATEDLLGPDILCWGTSLRAKMPDGKTFAGWHQDTAYADVRPIVLIVAAALSSSRAGDGCIRAMPGSHCGPLLPHKEAFGTNSLLTREQFIDCAIDEAAAVDLELDAGEIALFNNAIIHASNPNRGGDRRIHTRTWPVAWSTWLAAAGANSVEPKDSLWLEHTGLSVQAASNGLGWAIAHGPLVAGDILAGRLVAPFRPPLANDFAYFLVYPREFRSSTPVRIFRTWFRSEITRDLERIRSRIQ
ncbi:MAG: phytanoyl-CoA dioxygenase family protein, partial [Terriglobales bacterium]